KSWGSSCPPIPKGGSDGRRSERQIHLGGFLRLRGAGIVEGNVLSATGPATATKASSRPIAARARAGGARASAAHSSRGAVRRSGARAGLRPAARRGKAPVFGADHVPHPRRQRRGPGAARSVAPSELPGAAVAGGGAPPALVLGHHQGAGPVQV